MATKTRRASGTSGGRVHYRERNWAPIWVFAIIWGSFVASIVGTASAGKFEAVMAAGGGAGWSELAPVAAAFGGVFLLILAIHLLFTCLDVEVHDDHVLVAFGPIRLVRKGIPFADIEAVRGLTYRPILEFGGWGVRWRGKRTAWTIRGNQAVAVTLQSGKEVYVGSRHPQRLAGAIRTAMRMGKDKDRS